MKKITFWMFVLFYSWQISAQTGTLVVGVDDGSPNGTQEAPVPLQDYYETSKQQFLYLASELRATGLVAGPITKIGWVAISVGTSGLQENYTISIKATDSPMLADTFETGAELVYGPTDFTPSAIGQIIFELDTPFDWDGILNLIIEVCAGDAGADDYTENVQCANSTMNFNSSTYFLSDSEISSCTVATGTVSRSRPLLIVTGNVADCLAPMGIAISNITSESADVSWDESQSETVTGYNFFVSTSPDIPTGLGEDVPDGNTYVMLEGLEPMTNYYFFVKSNCDADDSNWNGPFYFATACVPVTDFPFMETFDANSPTKSCWTIIDGNEDGLTWDLNGTAFPMTGQAAEFYIDFESSNDYLVTPQIDLGSVPKRLKFWLRDSGFIPESLDVRISTSGTDIADFDTTLLSLVETTEEYEEYEIDLSNYADTTVYIAFVNESDDIGFFLTIDNVLIEDIPSCPDQTGLVAGNITHNSVEVSWDEMNGVNSYEYIVTTSATPPALGTNTENTFIDDISGLISNTLYYLHVRTVCENDDFGYWISTSFTTLVAPATIPWTEPFTDPSLPDGWSLNSNWNVDDAYDEEYYLPGGNGNFIWKNVWNTDSSGTYFTTISVGEVEVGNVLSFNYSAKPWNTSSFVNGNFVVSISADGEPFTEIETVDTVGDLSWDNIFGPYDLTDYEGKYVQVRITANWGGGDDDDYYIGFDNFYIGPELSVPSFDKDALKVYPNPTKNILNVSYSNEISNVEIYNLVGQRVMTSILNTNEGQIDISTLSSGAYFVKVTSNNTTKTVKVIKQ